MRNDPCVVPPKSATNLNHFYPVAERNGKPLPKSRLTGFGSEQPEFAARNTATSESAQQKRGSKIPLIKVLAVKGLLSRSPLWVRGNAPRSYLTPSPDTACMASSLRILPARRSETRRSFAPTEQRSRSACGKFSNANCNSKLQ